jgi:hypothetical protein
MVAAKFRGGKSHIFPVKGKIVESVEIFTAPEYHSISINFQDKYSLTFVINPCMIVQTQYEEWNKGNSKLIKQWPDIHSEN